MRIRFAFNNKNICFSLKAALCSLAGILLLLMAPGFNAAAQHTQTLSNSASFKIARYKALPDAGYSIERVANDSSLRFSADSLRPQQSDYYWVRLVINNPYPNDEPYVIMLSNPLNYTLYQYDTAKHTWVGTTPVGQISGKFRKPGSLGCVFYKQGATVLYLKISLREVKLYHQALKPAVILKKEVVFAAKEASLVLTTLMCCIVLISFLSYNLYIYFQLKDKAYLYYVMVQVGALLYLLGIRFSFTGFLPYHPYNLQVMNDGSVVFFDINAIVMHAGVTIIFCGMMQFTRSFLSTQKFLPQYDTVLKYLSYGYFALESVSVLVTASGLYYLNTIAASNVYILLMISFCMITAIAAHRRKVKAARYFALANLLPLLFTAITSMFILLYGAAGGVLPEIAILSQILTFAVALVARIKLVNDELKGKEIKALKLESEVTLAEYRQRLVEEENKNINLTMQLEKEKNEQLQQKLEANQRELVGNSLYIHQKNKLLAELRNQMQDIDTLLPDAKPETIRNIQSSLKEGQHLDEEWDKFKLHFEQVHPSFFNELQASHPNLTKYELRLYAYFHINLSTKEIAALLNIAPASVRQAKARLNKKMGKGE